MKNVRAILLLIVLIIGLPFVATAAQQVEIVKSDGVAYSGFWSPIPTAEVLNDWDAGDVDDSRASIYSPGYNIMTLDFEDPTGGPYTAIKVKLRVNSAYNVWGIYDPPNELTVKVYYNGGDQIPGDWYLTLPENLDENDFVEYSNDWFNDMNAAELADLQVEIEEVSEDNWGYLQFSAVQVELISEVIDTPVTGPIPVDIDYRPYRSSNSLNYRSRGKVRVVIFGSAAVDVSQIDRESLRLAGVAPVRDRIRKVYSHADGARDEYHDLVLMFKTKQLIEALEKSRVQELKNGDDVSLNLTGNLKDDGATPIEGEDTAVVFGKRDKHKKKGKWKNHWKWWR